MERGIQEEDPIKLTDEQLQILEEERELHLSGKSQSDTRQQANEIIKGQRSF